MEDGRLRVGDEVRHARHENSPVMRIIGSDGKQAVDAKTIATLSALSDEQISALAAAMEGRPLTSEDCMKDARVDGYVVGNARCEWFDGHGTPHEREYPSADLVLVRRP